MKKKILAHIAILLILTGGFCNVYIKGISISGCGNQLSAFAADDTYSWESVSKDDLVTAFKYYCKSRNLVIEGSIADAVTGFTSTTFNDLCNTLGIDSTALQAELKKTTGGNLGLRFLFTQTGVNAYNRIFAEFLQNNELGVGDEVDNKVVYSGEWFQDDEGYGCYVFRQDTSNNSSTFEKGTQYRYSGETAFAMTSNGNTSTSFIVNYKNVAYTVYLNGYRSDRVSVNNTSGTTGQLIYRTGYYNGYVNIIKTNSNEYYVGGYYYGNGNLSSRGVVKLENVETEDVDVTVNTNNTTINNNTYNNNYTIIYNDGDYYDYDDDDEPDPSTPPGGGGGGGGDDPDPDEPPIVDPTPTPDPTVPDWDIELPEMPVGNEWLLYGLEKKFPWDIPFNLMYMLSLFAADPETPHFQGTLDLKVVQWDYDIDLAPFDDIARNVRNFEFVGFIIGLMLLTRKLIWG